MNHSDRSARNACPVCASGGLRVFLEVEDMPAQDGVVYETRELALAAPRGNIRLALCRSCLYIGNLDYDATLVNFKDYNYSQHHSRQYRDHVDALVTMLTGEYAIQNKVVVDVGCGHGHFLNEVCQVGDNRGIGIDPSLPVSEDCPIDYTRIELIKDFYSDRYRDRRGDLVSCRHVLDEIESPRGFLQSIAGSLADSNSLLYLEVPNAMRSFEQNLIWNIGFAKRSWFTAHSLVSLLWHTNLQVVSIEEQFGGEYLGILGRRSGEATASEVFDEKTTGTIISTLDSFARHLESEVLRWQKKVDLLREHGEQMVIWGAGMRGINFLHRFGDPRIFPKIVDINPDRQGSYLPGSGFLVEDPEVLRDFKPGRILLSNPGYKREISAELERMGVEAELESL